MDLNLKGRRALVTGASRGIGRAIAGQLASEGCHLVMVARDREALDAAASRLSGVAESVPVPVAVDVSDAEAVEHCLRGALGDLGGLDILVNCIAAPVWGVAMSLDDASWDQVWHTKFLSYARMSRLALPLLEASGHGVIVNIIGVGGRHPSKDHIAGGSINAALMLLTTGMAKELANSRVRVVGINPGVVQTERFDRWADFIESHDSNTPDFRQEVLEATPTGTIVQPMDVANLAAFLASDRASQINGTTITIDGGATPTV